MGKFKKVNLDSLSVDLQVKGNQTLTAAEESCLYRITQEALNNIVKHARIKTANLYLHLSQPLYMEIEDRGIGFDPDEINGGGRMGLKGMSERAADIGWNFKVKSTPGQGCLIRVEKGSLRK